MAGAMNWLLALATLMLAGCASVNVHHDPARAHHRPDGFVNLHPTQERPAGGFWTWQWQRWIQGIGPQDPQRIPRVQPVAGYLRSNRSDTTVTWIGHSTTLWQVGGLNILTDPHFSGRASPVRFAGPQRATPPALTLDELPRIDVVFISHNHYDHLDLSTVQALHRQAGGPPLFVVPLGIDRWLANEGIGPVHVMDWWDVHRVQDLELTLVPAHHWSSRTPWDRNETLWAGLVLRHDGFSMYYSGDTGYSPLFRELGQRFGGFDFAQLPVGCYEPRWFMKEQHVNEAEAVQIHRDVRSKLSLGVHWGTFRLCDEAVDAPMDGLPRALQQMGEPPDRFVMFSLGETRVLRRGR
jgi:N-acyl-phosphatidylethanolamine-hydrolysing phospholipase D